METPAGISVYRGPNLTLDFVNTLSMKYSGLSGQEGKSFDQIFPEMMGTEIRKIYFDVFKTGKDFSANAFPISKDFGKGMIETKYFNFVVQANRDTDGKVIGITTYSFDVTNEIENKESLNLLFDVISHMVWVTDANGVINFSNNVVFEYTGFPKDTDQMKIWSKVVHEEDMKKIRPLWMEQFKKGELFESEYRIRNSQGQYRWHLVRTSPLKGPSGNIVKWFGTATDIHDQKLNQERQSFFEKVTSLLSEELEYKKTLNSIGQLIVPKLADWCVIDILEEGSKYPKTVVLEHVDPAKLKWAEKIREKYPTDWERADGTGAVLRTGKSEIYVNLTDELLRMGAKDDEHYETLKSVGIRSVILVPIMGAQNFPIGVMSLITSETNREFTNSDLEVAEEVGRRAGLAIDRSRLYERERSAREKAEAAKKISDEANMLKTTFLANMSHEMRTPLNALIGFNDLLRDLPNGSPEKEKYHSIVERNGELLLRLIDDILDLSKVESGNLNLERIAISLPDLIAEVSASLDMQARDKKIELSVKSDSSLPETVVTDPTRLRQILNNVIGNAIKFTEQGSATVHVSKTQSKKLRFVIEDTGVGIAEEAQPKLFRAFNQADPSTTRKYGGTGLGLALSKKLANSLGGDLWLHSSVPGKGSTFIFEIEGSVPEAKHSELFLGPREVRTGVKADQLKDKRILLVEDSPDNQALIERYLTVRGAIVEKADNGLVGIEAAMSKSYDLILMDMQMPVMDGFDATKKLRSQKYNKPIIALTAHAMEEDRRKCLEAGCNDFITKPVKASILADLIERNLKAALN
jgi:PAS domain S-box-containing protein